MRYSAAQKLYSENAVDGRKRSAVGGLPKRLVDVVIAASALIVLAPVLVLTGVLIRLVLGSPILMTERSVGLGGQVFALLSFRTEPNSSSSAGPWTEAVTTALRAAGIDRLPQLYNVVRSDMSLVGPELVDAQHALQYGMEGPELLLARPGLVSFRRQALHILGPSTGEIGLERLYVLRWSMWLDLRILWGALARTHAADTDQARQITSL